METKSIEERANKLAIARKNEQICTYDALVQIATEQDRIARVEERERCIKTIHDWLYNNVIHYKRVDGFHTEELIWDIIKAIEDSAIENLDDTSSK